ncbi:hypothetical protein F511_41175 [Dorcoceras hygrometricum]|uniref:Uncharacterized protein n=1 Tax=Dorcoceras hygrometricum TaxID=472368 RepID=A0A2Z6ZZV5_9LAMI|nr:hypothetical protein F511_41175 [Dorcoceras hygrometricum]
MLAESIDHSPPPEASNRVDDTPSLEDNYRARILRIDQDEARLTAQDCTWYEIKASTLRQSDISYVKDKAGITSLYEVVIPPIHARAHRPPVGFHTFYINQIDRGLRFPLDFDQLKRTPVLEVFESAGLHFMQSLAWFGEAASQFSKARAEVIKTKRSYDGVLGRHEALLKQLEEIHTKENVEKESLNAELESARAEAQALKIQVQSLETQVQSLETRAQLSEEESKLHLAEVEKLQEERANSWALEKEKFLKSKDFDSLCLKRAVMYFDKGFDGCLAQFRANGYSEEEHPASFLDVEQALVDMPDDPVEGSSGPGETPPA